MFTSYWRNYPWALQVALFMLMVFTMTSFGLVVVYWAVPHITGVTLDKIAGLHEGSARAIIDTALLGQFISTIFTFMVSAGLFAYVTHPRPAQYLGLRKPGKWVQLLIIGIMMAGFTPLVLGLEGIMRLVDMGPAIRASQKEKDDIFNAFLSMPSIKYLVVDIFILGITPAISEELVFRGVIMRFVQQRSVNIKTPIFVSALLFAIIHFDAYGFFPIFVSGALLGTVYYLTGSLWCSILAHAMHNSMQVGLLYAARQNVNLKSIIDGNAVPLYILVPAAILFAGGFYLLWKNKTPLPDTWAGNFDDPKPMQLNTFQITKRSMALNLPTFYKRTGSAIVFSIVMLGGMLWSLYAFFVLAAAIQVLCLRDYFRLISRIDTVTKRQSWLPVIAQAAGVLLLLLVLMSYNHMALWPALLCMPMLIILATTLSKRNGLMEGLQAIGGFVYILLPVSLLLWMRMTSLAIPLALVLMIWVNDTMAYLVGSFIGKRPFSPISPNKTWEGTAGGAFLTIAAAALWGHFAPWYHMADWMALALCASVAGTAGDLLESKLKRMARVKDSGTLMPGHGGALDRFDSLLVAAPFAFVYVYFFMLPVNVVVW